MKYQLAFGFLILCTVGLSEAQTCRNDIMPSTPDNRFSIVGGGMVNDHVTGLMWMRCSLGQSWDGSTCSGTASTMNWQNALTAGQSQSLGGHNDWRLPSVKELASLVEMKCINPSINSALFPETVSGWYWSSSPDAYGSDYAWIVYFSYGDVDTSYKGYSRSVRLVRAGQLLDISEPEKQITFLSETLPDHSYQTGSVIKQWRLQNGAAITGLTARVISASSGMGLTVGQEVALGDVPESGVFEVNLPLTLSHTGSAVKTARLVFEDVNGEAVPISNSATNEIWVTLTTNRAPQFAETQLSSTSAALNQTESFALWLSDSENDTLNFSVAADVPAALNSASVDENHQLQMQFSQTGLFSLTITASDGIASTEHTIEVVVTDGQHLDSLFSDIPFASEPRSDYVAAHHLAMLGIVIGHPDETNPGQRLYQPNQALNQAEALKILMLSAQQRGLVNMGPSQGLLNNLVVTENGQVRDFRWAEPYVIAASSLGLVDAIYAFDPAASVTRQQVADWVAALLYLTIPMDIVSDEFAKNNLLFTDQASFASNADYQVALTTAFFQIWGRLGQSFGPASLVTRIDMAHIGSRILRQPQLDEVTLSLGQRNGQYTVAQGESFDVLDIPGLHHQQVSAANNALSLIAPFDPAQIEVVAVIEGGTPSNRVTLDSLTNAPLAVSADISISEDKGVDLFVLLQDKQLGVINVLRQPMVVEFPDSDGDGVQDSLDAFPFDARYQSDIDGDGIPDAYETAKGLSSTQDNRQIDSDGDGLTDAEEYTFGTEITKGDSDGDGISDGWEVEQQLNPLNASDASWDIDTDGLTNLQEFDKNTLVDNADSDGDGRGDATDAFPNDASEVDDFDGDGIGNNADPDIDGDNVNNGSDRFPFDPAEWLDTDNDGTGNNADTDDDNDGFSDTEELAAGTDPLDGNDFPRDNTATRYDQNGDGQADLVWRSTTTGQNWYYAMNGHVIANSKPINTVNTPWQLVGRGDFDGDGKSDLLWRNQSTGLNYIYLMDGHTIRSGKGVNTVPVGIGWDIASIGDYNGDNKDDMLWRNSNTGILWQYQMNGFTIIASKQVTTISDNEWQIAGSPDLNGDGKADLLFRHASTGLVWKYIMNGHVITSSAQVMAAGAEWQLVITGDFDGDGDADILWRNTNDGRNYVYLLDNGVVNWSNRGLISQFTDQNWQAVMAGDFDGDGDDDIFWRHFGDGRNYMYLMEGTSFVGKNVNTVGDLTWGPIK